MKFFESIVKPQKSIENLNYLNSNPSTLHQNELEITQSITSAEKGYSGNASIKLGSIIRALSFPLLLLILLFNLKMTEALNVDSHLTSSNGGFVGNQIFKTNEAYSSELMTQILKERDQLAASVKERDQLATSVKEKDDIIQAKDEIIVAMYGRLKAKDEIITSKDIVINECNQSVEAVSLLLLELNEKVDLQAIIRDHTHKAIFSTLFPSLTKPFNDKQVDEHFIWDLSNGRIIHSLPPSPRNDGSTPFSQSLHIYQSEQQYNDKLGDKQSEKEGKEMKVKEEEKIVEGEEEKVVKRDEEKEGEEVSILVKQRETERMGDIHYVVKKRESNHKEKEIERGKQKDYKNEEKINYGELKQIKRDLSIAFATWTLQTDNAQWKGRLEHTSVVVSNNIVTMGGCNAAVLNDVWLSVDSGVSWILQTSAAPWAARNGHTSVVIGNNIVIMGGAFLNDVWLSVNSGLSWTLQTDHAPWSGRSDHSSVVVGNNIFIMGGTTEGNGVYFNDVWLSVNSGGNWTLQTSNAQWGVRAYHTSVVIGSSVVTMGGHGYSTTYFNDVWLSVNSGGNWTLQTTAAPWDFRYSHTSVVVGSNIVIMGGRVGVYSFFSNDVWLSVNNGVSWTLQTSASLWSARYSHTSVVIGNNIITMGGAYGGVANDVWVQLYCAKSNIFNGTACTACLSPSPGYYVTSICFTSDTVISRCSTPSLIQYIAVACVPGNSTKLGSNGMVTSCSIATSGNFTTQTCVSGSYNVIGSDAVIKSCTSATNPPSGFFVFSLCEQGSPDKLGSDFIIKECSKPSGKQIVVSACDPGSINRIGSDSTFVVAPVSCPFPYFLDPILTCACEALYYASGSKCMSCSNDLNCPSNTLYSNVTVAPGRFKVINDEYQLTASLPCPLNAKCNTTGETTICNDGFTGYQCNSCSQGFYDLNSIRDPLVECDICPNDVGTHTAVIFSIIGAVLLGCLVVSFLTYIKFKKNKKAKKENGNKTKKVTSVLQRITLTHLQIISIIGQFGFQWPSPSKTFYNASGSVSSLSFMNLAGNVLGGIKCTLYLSNLPVAANELLLLIYQLLVAVILMLLFWFVFAQFRRKGSNYLEKLKSNDGGDKIPVLQCILITFISIIYLMYSSFTKAVFQLFSCLSHNPFGGQKAFSNNQGISAEDDYYANNTKLITSRLQGSPDIVCYSKEHINILLSLALPVILIILIGMPLFAFAHIYRNKSKGESESLVSTWGFLFSGYKDKLWFFEWIILLRKIALSAIVVLLSTSDTYIQGLSALFVLIVAQAIQNWLNPYETEGYDLNHLESTSLLVSLFSIYLGMWTFANSSSSSQVAVTVMVIGLNLIWGGFVLFTLYQGYKEETIKMLNRYCFACCCKKKKSINKHDIVKEERSNAKEEEVSIVINNPLNKEGKSIPMVPQKNSENKSVRKTAWSSNITSSINNEENREQ